MNDLNTKKIISFIGAKTSAILMYVCDEEYLSVFWGILAICYFVYFNITSLIKKK